MQIKDNFDELVLRINDLRKLMVSPWNNQRFS